MPPGSAFQTDDPWESVRTDLQKMIRFVRAPYIYKGDYCIVISHRRCISRNQRWFQCPNLALLSKEHTASYCIVLVFKRSNGAIRYRDASELTLAQARKLIEPVGKPDVCIKVEGEEAHSTIGTYALPAACPTSRSAHANGR